MSKEVSVFTVTGNELLQSAFAALLSRHSSLHHAGSSGTVRDALLQIRAMGAPHLVISDSPPANVYEALVWREVQCYTPRLLMLANYVREPDGVLAVLAGAAALIQPPAGNRQGLIDAILRIADGESILPEGVIARLRRLSSKEAGLLSEKEARALELIIERCTDEEIAAREAVPLSQVRSWVSGIAEKLI